MNISYKNDFHVQFSSFVVYMYQNIIETYMYVTLMHFKLATAVVLEVLQNMST